MTSTADLPPPSYNEALIFGLQQDSESASSLAESERSHHPRQVSLSSIDEYSFSWLYPIILKVKETLEQIGQGLELMENSNTTLGRKIQDLDCKTYPALIVMSLTGIVVNVEGDLLTYGVEPWKAWQIEGLFDNEELVDRLPGNYSTLKHVLQQAMGPLRLWVQGELILDREWPDRDSQRDPAITNYDIRKLKHSVGEVSEAVTSMHEWREEHNMELGLADYATDSLLKMDLEYLLSYLTRIADVERAVNNVVDIPEEEQQQQEEEEEMTPAPSAPALEEYSLPSALPEEENPSAASCPSPTTSRPSSPPPLYTPGNGAAMLSLLQQPPPQYSVNRYRNTAVYKILFRLKDAIDKIAKETERMRKPSFLGAEIRCLRIDELREMKATALQMIIGGVEDFHRGQGDLPSRQRVFIRLQGQIRLDLQKLLRWARPQQQMDEEWTESTPRIPTLSPDERTELQKMTMVLLNRVADIYDICLHERVKFTVHDYAADLVVKDQLEILQELLIRVGDDEINKKFGRQISLSLQDLRQQVSV